MGQAARRRWSWLGLALIPLVAGLSWLGYARWRERRYDAFIVSAAARYAVDPALVKAIVWRESRFRASARGRAGEFGLMQIRSAAASEWVAAERVANFQVEHLLDPGTNTLAGTWYLARLLRRYQQTDDPVPFALADYNAGRSNVLRWNHGTAATNAIEFLRQIGFPGTRRYIESVQHRQMRYASLARSAEP